MRLRPGIAIVSAGNRRPPVVIRDLAIQLGATGRAARDHRGAAGAGEGKITGRREIGRQHVADGRPIRPGDGRDGDGDGVALADGDGGRILAAAGCAEGRKGEGEETGADETGGLDRDHDD